MIRLSRARIAAIVGKGCVAVAISFPMITRTLAADDSSSGHSSTSVAQVVEAGAYCPSLDESPGSIPFVAPLELRHETFCERFRSFHRRLSWRKSTWHCNFMYWDASPYCIPNYGYHPTTWRRGACQPGLDPYAPTCEFQDGYITEPGEFVPPMPEPTESEYSPRSNPPGPEAEKPADGEVVPERKEPATVPVPEAETSPSLPPSTDTTSSLSPRTPSNPPVIVRPRPAKESEHTVQQTPSNPAELAPPAVAATTEVVLAEPSVTASDAIENNADVKPASIHDRSSSHQETSEPTRPEPVPAPFELPTPPKRNESRRSSSFAPAADVVEENQVSKSDDCHREGSASDGAKLQTSRDNDGTNDAAIVSLDDVGPQTTATGDEPDVNQSSQWRPASRQFRETLDETARSGLTVPSVANANSSPEAEVPTRPFGDVESVADSAPQIRPGSTRGLSSRQPERESLQSAMTRGCAPISGAEQASSGRTLADVTSTAVTHKSDPASAAKASDAPAPEGFCHEIAHCDALSRPIHRDNADSYPARQKRGPSLAKTVSDVDDSVLPIRTSPNSEQLAPRADAGEELATHAPKTPNSLPQGVGSPNSTRNVGSHDRGNASIGSTSTEPRPNVESRPGAGDGNAEPSATPVVLAEGFTQVDFVGQLTGLSLNGQSATRDVLKSHAQRNAAPPFLDSSAQIALECHVATRNVVGRSSTTSSAFKQDSSAFKQDFDRPGLPTRFVNSKPNVFPIKPSDLATAKVDELGKTVEPGSQKRPGPALPDPSDSSRPSSMAAKPADHRPTRSTSTNENRTEADLCRRFKESEPDAFPVRFDAHASASHELNAAGKQSKPIANRSTTAAPEATCEPSEARRDDRSPQKRPAAVMSQTNVASSATVQKHFSDVEPNAFPLITGRPLTSDSTSTRHMQVGYSHNQDSLARSKSAVKAIYASATTEEKTEADQERSEATPVHESQEASRLGRDREDSLKTSTSESATRNEPGVSQVPATVNPQDSDQHDASIDQTQKRETSVEEAAAVVVLGDLDSSDTTPSLPKTDNVSSSEESPRPELSDPDAQNSIGNSSKTQQAPATMTQSAAPLNTSRVKSLPNRFSATPAQPTSFMQALTD